MTGARSRLGYVLLSLSLVFLAGQARSAWGQVGGSGSVDSNTASAPSPANTPIGRRSGGTGSSRDGPNTEAETPELPPADCVKPIPAALQGGSSRVVVELDPDTIWRPRGSEVRFVIRGDGIAVTNVQACFAWSRSAGNLAAENYTPSPLVRSISNLEGKIEYGAVVPDLKPVNTFWFARILGRGETRFTGMFIVPIADMQVLATVVMPDGAAVRVPIVLPVGVTSVWYAVILVLLTVALALACLYWVASRRDLPGRSAFLKAIATKDGFASLSQFQILLWTFLVGAAAIYVMALSGNLIGVTPGTLILLGIAGATTLLARIPPAGSGSAQDDAAASQPAAAGRTPKWSDLIVVDGAQQEIDVTRVQMLIFTMVSAVFVGLKVLTSYEIPEIPEGFLLLMGISNGVYITGRHLPSGGRNDGSTNAAQT